MNKKVIRGVLIALGAVILASGIVYLGFAGYYSRRFSYRTYINGVYCTGRGVESVSRELSGKVGYMGLTVIDKDGTEYRISPSDVDFKADYSDSVKRIFDSASPLCWGRALAGPLEYEADCEISFNEEKLNTLLAGSDFCNSNVFTETANAELVRTTDNGYVIKDATIDMVHPELVYDAVSQAILSMEDTLDLKEAGVYESLPETAERQNLYSLYERIDSFQNFKLTYVFDDGEEVIDSGVVATWIQHDKNGNFVFDDVGNPILDDVRMRVSLDRIIDRHESVNKQRQFKTTAGKEITLEPGLYGNDIDNDAEFEWVHEAFTKGYTKRVREPKYLCRARATGENDIGDTYVEVDIENQMLYYYEDGELALETEVVTGNERTHCSTPAKLCYVYYKQRNRTLHGPNYATFVYYWMAVNGHIGLHDATWRRKFGGEIYKTDGSHGCVNMPKAKAGELYDMLELGTPVIIF